MNYLTYAFDHMYIPFGGVQGKFMRAPRGSVNIYKRQSANPKLQLTVVVICSPVFGLMRPQFIVPKAVASQAVLDNKKRQNQIKLRSPFLAQTPAGLRQELQRTCLVTSLAQ